MTVKKKAAKKKVAKKKTTGAKKVSKAKVATVKKKTATKKTTNEKKKTVKKKVAKTKVAKATTKTKPAKKKVVVKKKGRGRPTASKPVVENAGANKIPKMTPLPAGSYAVKVGNVAPKTAKTGRQMVLWDLVVIGRYNDLDLLTMKHKGRHLFCWDVAEPYHGSYLQKKLALFDIRFTKWAEIEPMLHKAVGQIIQVGLRGEFPKQVTFFNKLLDDGILPADDDDDFEGGF